MNHLLRLWHFSSSINSFFKHSCTAIQLSDFWSDPSSTSIPHECEQPRLWQDCAGWPETSLVAYVVSTIITWAGLLSSLIYMIWRFWSCLHTHNRSSSTCSAHIIKHDVLHAGIKLFSSEHTIVQGHWKKKMSHVMRKTCFAICEQQRCRSACTSAQSDQLLCCSLLR